MPPPSLTQLETVIHLNISSLIDILLYIYIYIFLFCCEMHPFCLSLRLRQRWQLKSGGKSQKTSKGEPENRKRLLFGNRWQGCFWGLKPCLGMNERSKLYKSSCCWAHPCCLFLPSLSSVSDCSDLLTRHNRATMKQASQVPPWCQKPISILSFSWVGINRRGRNLHIGLLCLNNTKKYTDLVRCTHVLMMGPSY